MRDKVIIYVAVCQMLLEITDELKETRIYKQSTKNLVNRLQKNLEDVMSGEVGRGFAEDANDFNTLLNSIFGIQNKLVNKKLVDLVKIEEEL